MRHLASSQKMARTRCRRPNTGAHPRRFELHHCRRDPLPWRRKNCRCRRLHLLFHRSLPPLPLAPTHASQPGPTPASAAASARELRPKPQIEPNDRRPDSVSLTLPPPHLPFRISISPPAPPLATWPDLALLAQQPWIRSSAGGGGREAASRGEAGRQAEVPGFRPFGGGRPAQLRCRRHRIRGKGCCRPCLRLLPPFVRPHPRLSRPQGNQIPCFY